MTCGKINVLKTNLFINKLDVNLKNKEHNANTLNLENLNRNSLYKLKYLHELLNNENNEKKNESLHIN